MRPQIFFADIPPLAGILLVLATVALSGLMWAIFFAGSRLAEAHAARRAKAAETLVGKSGVIILVADTASGYVRLDEEGGASVQLRCRTENGVVEKGERVRVTGYDRNRRLHVVVPLKP